MQEKWTHWSLIDWNKEIVLSIYSFERWLDWSNERRYQISQRAEAIVWCTLGSDNPREIRATCKAGKKISIKWVWTVRTYKEARIKDISSLGINSK